MNLDQIIRFRNFKKAQLLATVFILSFLGWVILWVNDLLKMRVQIPEYITGAPEPIMVVAFFSFLTLGFVIAEGLWKWFRSSNTRDKTYKFKGKDWPNEWIFNGKTEPGLGVDDLYVKSSRAGCLLRNYVWKDFRMTFKMRFEDRPGYDKHLGIVFRAIDLDNYFMLEVCEKSRHCDGNSCLKPHVRYQSGWELIDYEKQESFNFSDFVDVVLEVKEDIVTFFYQTNEVFKWILPTHVDVNHIESGVKQDNSKEKVAMSVEKVVQEIPFRIIYGMVGFRAHPGQGAIIRNLKVEPL